MERATSPDNRTPSQRINAFIAELPDWRGKRLSELRKVLHELDPQIVEEWKWGTAVWSHNGNVVAFAAFKDYVKLNFFKGASLKDPHRLFNSGLEAKITRAIDIHEADKIDDGALKEIIRQAVAQDAGKKKSSKK